MKTKLFRTVMLVSLLGLSAVVLAKSEIDLTKGQQTDPGAAAAIAAFASGQAGWYYVFYSNMPSGPDDPVLAQKRDLFVAVLAEKGIKAIGSRGGPSCIPSVFTPEEQQFEKSYNAMSDRLLKGKLGPSYMEDIHKEVARRMLANPAKA
ncbi:MAG: hypothetical protein V4857_27035 [Pseudomonadota bacterium]